MRAYPDVLNYSHVHCRHHIIYSCSVRPKKDYYQSLIVKNIMLSFTDDPKANAVLHQMIPCQKIPLHTPPPLHSRYPSLRFQNRLHQARPSQFPHLLSSQLTKTLHEALSILISQFWSITVHRCLLPSGGVLLKQLQDIHDGAQTQLGLHGALTAFLHLRADDILHKQLDVR